MIVLRPVTMDDRDILMSWRNDLDMRTATGIHPAGVTLKEHELWLAKWICLMQQTKHEGLYVAIETVAAVLIGTGRITANAESQVPAMCLVHYSVALEYRRKGYGTQLVRALVHKALSEMGYNTVGAQIHRQNTASLKCALMGGVTAVQFL